MLKTASEIADQVLAKLAQQGAGPQQGQRMYNPPPGQERRGLARANYSGQGPTPRAEHAAGSPPILGSHQIPGIGKLDVMPAGSARKYYPPQEPEQQEPEGDTSNIPSLEGFEVPGMGYLKFLPDGSAVLLSSKDADIEAESQDPYRQMNVRKG